MLGNILATDMMQPRPKPPVVSGSYLYGPSVRMEGIRLDTAAWWAWLDEPTSRSFAYPVMDEQKGYIVGFMTVRKERRQRGGSYWVVYRRHAHTVRKIYLGRTSAVTHERLTAIADSLQALP